jgi:glycosyltransferase-like protein
MSRPHPNDIAFFTYSTKPRGSVIHTLALANALHDLGQQVCVYALDKDGKGFDYPLRCQYQPVPAEPVQGDLDTVIRQRIQEFVEFLETNCLKQRSHDYYHAQDCISANALLILRKQQLIPHCIRTVHHIEDYNSAYLRECQDRSIYEPDLCLCVSQYWQTQLKDSYEINAPRVFNGVNREQFLQVSELDAIALKEQLELTGSPIYLTVGGIEPRKNSITLLNAFLQVLTHYPQAQLVIAGGATLFDYQSYRDEFFVLVQQYDLHVRRSLILPGVISDQYLPALYYSADAFVFPSIKEGWGLVVLEAIASRLPVITSNQVPFTEFLTEQQALLVDPHSPDAIAQAMQQVLQPEVAQALIEHSQVVCEQYTWEASAKMHLEHYRSHLSH